MAFAFGVTSRVIASAIFKEVYQSTKPKFRSSQPGFEKMSAVMYEAFIIEHFV